MKYDDWPEFMKYPVLADLPRDFKLIAHPNCAAVCNGEVLAVMSSHVRGQDIDDVLEAAQDKFMDWAHKLLVDAGHWPQKES